MTFLMTYGADLLMILASLGAMGYCMVLSRRLNRLTSFDKGLGGAIAVMSSQVDEMKAALREAKAGSDGAGTQLNELVHQAKDIATELEMMIAACHDFAEEAISAHVADPVASDSIDEPHPTAHESPEAVAPDPTPHESEPSGDVTPIFGSRRAHQDGAGAPKSAAEPLFRHRKVAAG